jgi:lipopolysaccharide biosynthesis regulator YciM
VAVLIAAAGGLVAGRAYAHARHRGLRDRPGFRTSAHYSQGLHYLASGQVSLALSELGKVVREDPDAVDVLQVLSHLQRETGQVERAIHVHQALLSRRDLTRAERAHTLASLGTDFRKAGFLDRAERTFSEALEVDANNLYALMGQRKVYEDHQRWVQAYDVQIRLSRLRKADDGLVLGHLQARIGEDAARAGDREAAETAFRTALTHDRRVAPASLGLADLFLENEPARAAAELEEVERASPERAYLAFDRLERAYTALSEPERFVETCERIIRQGTRDWRARLALARHLRARGRLDEAAGILLRAVEANPQALIVHLELLRTLKARGEIGDSVRVYLETTERSVFYLDPHLCIECRYRADGMLWRCPHCHEWNTFVEERLGPTTLGS